MSAHRGKGLADGLQLIETGSERVHLGPREVSLGIPDTSFYIFLIFNGILSDL